MLEQAVTPSDGQLEIFLYFDIVKFLLNRVRCVLLTVSIVLQHLY
jgi:hypothetical protein